MAGQLRSILSPGLVKVDADADGFDANTLYALNLTVTVGGNTVVDASGNFSAENPFGAGSVSASIDAGFLTISCREQISANPGDAATVVLQVDNADARSNIFSETVEIAAIPERTSQDL